MDRIKESTLIILALFFLLGYTIFFWEFNSLFFATIETLEIHYPRFYFGIWMALKLSFALALAPFLYVLFFIGNQQLVSNWRMSHKSTAYLIFFLGIVVRIAYLFLTDPIGTGTEDGVSRLLGTDTWLRDGGNLPGLPGWLPLHGVLIGLYVKLGIPILWAGRLLSFTFSLFLMIYGYKIAKKLYNKRIANYTLAFLAFLPWIVVNSTENMTEMLFVTFLAIAFYQIIANKKKYNIFIVGICLASCNLIRFEGWIFTFTVIPVLVMYGHGLKRIATYFSIASSTIIGYMIYSVLGTGFLAYGITQSDLYVSTFGTHLMYLDTWRNIVSVFLYEPVYPVWLWLLLFTSIFFAFYKKDTRIKGIAVLISLPLLAIVLKLVLGTLDFGWRYLASVLIMLLPLSAYGLYQIEKLSNRFLVFTLFFGLLFWGNAKKIHYLQDYRTGSLEQGFVETAEWFKENSTDSTMLIMDVGGHHDAGWVLYSKMRAYQIYNVDTMYVDGFTEPAHIQTLSMYKNNEFDYALTRKDSYLYRYLKRDNSQVQDTVLFYDWYQIYKLK